MNLSDRTLRITMKAQISEAIEILRFLNKSLTPKNSTPISEATLQRLTELSSNIRGNAVLLFPQSSVGKFSADTPTQIDVTATP